MAKRERRVAWFARGGGIARCGPYKSQVEATQAMRLVTETDVAYRRAVLNGATRKQLKGGFPDDVFVWPEEVR